MSRIFFEKSGGSWAKKLFKDQDGGPAAEFALILVPMVVIFVLIIQFGILFLHNDMHTAARYAVRQMSAVEGIAFSDGTPTSCQSGPITVNTVEDVACRRLTTWGGFVDFSIEPTVTQLGGSDDGLCDQIEVLVSANMVDASIYNIFGVFTGRNLIANAIMRSQWDVITNGTINTGGRCI